MRQRSTLAMTWLVPASAGIAGTALFAVRVSSPAIVLLATVSLFSTKPLSPPSPSLITPVIVQSRMPRRLLIIALLSLSALSFFIDGLAYLANAVFSKEWSFGNGVELASVFGLAAYAGLAALGAWKDINNIEVWSFRRVKLAIAVALALDVAQIILLALSPPTRDLAHFCNNTKLSKCISETFHLITPCLRVIFLVPLLFALYLPRVVYTHVETQPETEGNGTEAAPLVSQSDLRDGPSGEGGKYGTFVTQIQCESGPATVSPDVKETSLMRESCFAILCRLGPHVCPSNSMRLRFATAVTALLHFITRLLKPLSPLSLGAAVNALSSHPSAASYPIPMPFGSSPYPYVALLLSVYFLTSPGGIPALVSVLGSRVAEHADTALKIVYDAHLEGLSLGQPGDARTKSSLYPTRAASKVLEALSVLVAGVLDSAIGVVVLGLLFGWKLALAVFLTLSVYVYVTGVLTRVLSLSTLPDGSARLSAVSLLFLVQALIASGGLLLGSLYIAREVVNGVWSVGSWAAWIWYWSALLLPLSSVPCLYRVLADVCAVFDVLKHPAEIVDSGKESLGGDGGVEVRFENVSFTYPYSAEHAHPYGPVLSSVSFDVPASSTVALVGTLGSGKSTIMKLLYRLYDTHEGSVYVDGKDIRCLSLSGLREKLAIIPKGDAVERRDAVSRALANSPRLLLVEGDLEADVLSLVDRTRTVLWEVEDEHLGSIQEGVDQIVVVKNGQVVEQGTFKELLEANGTFTSMWAIHIHALKAPVLSTASASGYEVEGAAILSSDRVVADSPRAATVSLRPADSVRVPSVRTESVAPTVPTKDNAPISFPTAGSEEGPLSSPTAVAFPTEGTGAPAPVAFPTSDDARSVSSQPHPAIPDHVHSASVTFDMTGTPLRAGTPDLGSEKQEPAAEGKRKRISSQNFQRIARRISLSTPRKGPTIPGIANLTNVLKRDGSFRAESKDKDKADKEESKDGEGIAKDADVVSATGSGSGPASGADSARNSGEISREDKEREKKKRKRMSFMQIGSLGGSLGSSGST